MNRKERRKKEKNDAKHTEKTIIPFTKLCEEFASEYLSGTLQPDFDVQALVDKYDKNWREMARSIISKDKNTFYLPDKPELMKTRRTNLLEGFKRFSANYMGNPNGNS